MNSLKIMKTLQKKHKQGHKVSNVPEFLTLVDLCSSDERTERLSACKCIFYLWDWKVIDNKTMLSVMSSVSNKATDVDGILAVFFSIVSQLCETNDTAFIKNELPLFQRSLTNMLTTHEPAVLVMLSIFDQMDFDFVFKYYKPVVYDIMFGDFTNRNLIWSLITKKFNSDLHRSFILWLKFHSLEDCFILLGSLKVMDISDTEKCLYLTILIRTFMASGQNPQEVITIMKDHVLNTSIHTQSLIILTLLVGLESLSQQYLFAAFNLCEWFIQTTMLWTEILWMMLVYIIPFTRASSYYPVYREKALKLISMIKEKIEAGTSVDMKMTPMKSVVYKYALYRHDCLHQTLLAMRILHKYKTDDIGLMKWLKELYTSHLDPKFGIFDGIVARYLLTRSLEIKKMCLSILEKYDGANAYLLTFQLQREDDPVIINEILRILSTQRTWDDKVVINQILSSLSKESHDRSFNVQLSLLKHACKRDYKFDDELRFYFSEKNNFIDTVTQAELVKAVAFNTNNHFEEVISFCNKSVNFAKLDQGDLSTSLVIDAILVMCEKAVLDVTLIWDNLLKIVAGEQHPAIHNSVCNFLARVPVLLKHRPDENRIYYKSARVLWHFANEPSMNQKLALRCLRDYDLEVFDTSFLSDECQTHIKHNTDESVLAPIKGHCWVHMIKDDSFLELFIHYINKTKSKARFRGSYSKLFEGIMHYLNSCSLEDEDNIKMCLKLLCASWTSVPAGKDFSCLERFISNSCSNSDYKDLTVRVILNFLPINHSSKSMFDKFLLDNTYTEKQKAIMCLLPANFLEKQREINEDIVFDGILFALSTDAVDLVSDRPLSAAVEKVMMSFANNYSTSLGNRRLIMKVLFTLWIKMPFNSEVFTKVSNLIAVIYGYPFLKSIASQMEGDLCRKYLILSKQIALHTKLMRCFDINLGLRHVSFQDEIIEQLVLVLKEVGNENQSRNLKWILRVVCMCAMSTNDYLSKVVIYGMNYLSGASMFITTDSLKDNLDIFPLSASVISKLTRKGKNMTFTMSEITKKTLRVHPAFIEAFKLAVLRIRDEPSITYETVTKKCFE